MLFVFPLLLKFCYPNEVSVANKNPNLEEKTTIPKILVVVVNDDIEKMAYYYDTNGHIL